MNAAVILAEGSNGPNYMGELFILGGIFLTGILAWISAIIAKRVREPTRIETLWTRLDAQDVKIETLTTRVAGAERRGDAAVGVVRDLVRQWPHGHIPRLNPVEIDELDEDTIPADWRVKP